MAQPATFAELDPRSQEVIDNYASHRHNIEELAALIQILVDTIEDLETRVTTLEP